MLAQEIAGRRRHHAPLSDAQLGGPGGQGVLGVAHCQNILTEKIHVFRFAVLHFHTSKDS
jgi:hypothetical protein